MRTMKVHRLLAGFAALLVASFAHAHPGHGETSLMTGLLHPFGLDHLLVMVAVGLWSATMLPSQRAWQGPACFLLALVIGAGVGLAGGTVAFLEHGLALSVVMLGAMLVLVARPSSPALGLGLVALAAVLHGLAHGAEAPATGFASYAFGFVLTTAMLHLGGVSVALAIKRWFGTHRTVVLRSLGSLMGALGLVLFARLVF